MAKILTNVQKLGRILESECPYADLVIPTIRTLSNILDKWSREGRIHQEARNFCARLYTTLSHIRRFGDFSTVFCAATLLSPSKDKRSALMPSEEERAKLYLEEMGRSLTTEEPHILQATVAESETIELIDDPIEDIFKKNVVCPEKQHPTSLCTTFNKEFSDFLAIDEDILAFDFFKRENKRFPRLSKVAKTILSVIPSPALAERMFSKAQSLTECRRNRLKTENLKLRLQCLL